MTKKASTSLYVLFGVLVLAVTAVTELRGYTTTRPDQVKDVPRTVRDNPGSYRPTYAFIGSRFSRGK